MYKITINNVTQIHEFEELIKVFLQPSDYKIFNNDTIIDNLKTLNDQFELKTSDLKGIEINVPEELTLNFKGAGGRNAIKQYLFKALKEYTGITPDWGIHTGVRPVKLVFELLEKEGSLEGAKRVLLDYYLMSPEKVTLLLETYYVQSGILEKSPENAKGIYLGIPFCPTRCEYCSFPSNQGKPEEIEAYLKALFMEMDFVASNMKAKGWYPETFYIGGGTPTALTDLQLEMLLIKINSLFNLNKLKEFTLEAGRPDTISGEKLNICKKNGVTRISINPQSMKQETLNAIGRSHTLQDINDAFNLAKASEIPIINSDLIAGLPDESKEDFLKSLKQILALGAQNITIHTLAVKRASRLKLRDENFHRREGIKVREMLIESKKILDFAGYKPYYMYRQKQMIGNFENVGYAKPNTENLYNIRIMEEAQTIIAMGAGGISKVYYADENRLERVPNVSNFQIYIDRINEMIERKAKGIFD